MVATEKNPADSRAIASDIHNGRTITVRLGWFQLPRVENLDDVTQTLGVSVAGEVLAQRGSWVAYEPDDGRRDGTYWHEPTVTWTMPAQPVTVPTLVRGWYCPAYFLVEGFDNYVRLFAQNVALNGPVRLEITEVLQVGRDGSPITAQSQRLPLGKLTTLVRTAARVASVLYPFGYDGPGYKVVDGRLVEITDGPAIMRRAKTATAEQLAAHGLSVELRPALWGRDAVTQPELRRTRASGPRMVERDLRAAELADEPAAKGRIYEHVEQKLLEEGFVIGGRENLRQVLKRGRKLRAEKSTKNTNKKGGKK